MFRRLTWFTLTILLAGVVCWNPQSGQMFGGTPQVELSVKTLSGTSKNSALWIRNLSNHITSLAVAGDSMPVQRSSSPPLSIAGGATMQIDGSLQEASRGNNELLIRSEEQIAAIAAPDDLPIDRSEFYYAGLTQAGIGAVRTPKWVMELAARGKTGTNVLKAESTGYAPAVRGQSEVNKRYLFGVGVALGKKNSAVEIKLISKTGQVVQSLVLSSSIPLFWQGELGEFVSGTETFPSRLELTVLHGKSQGFLSMKNVETDKTTLLTIIPKNSGSKGGGFHTASCNQGTAYFTDGLLNCPSTSYAYEVFNGPPNSCGELHIVRNGQQQVTGCWLVTDGNGYAFKGPWTVSTDQTGTSIYIQWPNGCTTTGDDYKIDDASPPSIDIDSCGSSVIEGSASDAQWGVGFNSSSVYASFRQTYSPFYYWNGSGYNSPSEWFFSCSISPFFGGYNINWSIVPPPSAGSTRVHVIASDICNEAERFCFY